MRTGEGFFAGQHEHERVLQLARWRREIAAFGSDPQGRGDFGNDDLREARVGFEQDRPGWAGAWRECLVEQAMEGFRRDPQISSDVDQVGDELREHGFGLRCFARSSVRRGQADVDATSGAQLGPALADEPPVGEADGVRMQGKAAGEHTHAGQAGSRAELTGEDRQGELGDDLILQRDFAGVDEPQAHTGHCNGSRYEPGRKDAVRRSGGGEGCGGL